MLIYFRYEIQKINISGLNKHMGGTDHEDLSMNKILS